MSVLKITKTKYNTTKHIPLIIESLHNLPLDKISTLLKRLIQFQLQIIHKLVIPNCKGMLNVLYHKPWSKPKVVVRQNKGDTHLV